MSDQQQAFFDANRQLWNTRAQLHPESRFYNVEAFRRGESSLSGLEQQEMDPLAGSRLLHLQCHFGLDTLSLARLGATVTGVDFSEEAIKAARSLATEQQIEAEFRCHNVLAIPEDWTEQFHHVFASFGVLGWLPDLHQWAEVVRRFLLPGGSLYLLEFHPYFQQHDEQGVLTYGYFHSADPDEEVATQTYADGLEHEPLREYWWNHTLSDVVNAIRESGLQIELFREHAWSPYCLGAGMVEDQPGQWVYRQHGRKMPYMYSIKARQPS